jgi:hypothetical protein
VHRHPGGGERHGIVQSGGDLHGAAGNITFAFGVGEIQVRGDSGENTDSTEPVTVIEGFESLLEKGKGGGPELGP